VHKRAVSPIANGWPTSAKHGVSSVAVTAHPAIPRSERLLALRVVLYDSRIPTVQPCVGAVTPRARLSLVGPPKIRRVA
jgi:hypothetical protein